MRDKATKYLFLQTRNCKILLFDQQLQLTLKQIVTKNGQYCFPWLWDFHFYSFFAFWSNNPARWKGSSMLLQKNIMQFYVARLHVISSIIDQALFLKYNHLWKHERIIKHAFLGKELVLGAYCDIYIYMLHIAIYVCTYVGCMLPA